MTAKTPTPARAFAAVVCMIPVLTGLVAGTMPRVATASLDLNLAYMKCDEAQHDTALAEETERVIGKCCRLTTDTLKYVLSAMEHNAPVVDDIDDIAVIMAKYTMKCITAATAVTNWTQPPRELELIITMLEVGKTMAMGTPSG